MTVRNPNPAHKKNILPGLQVPSGLDVELEKYLQAVKEHLQVLQGVLGQPKERAVTLTDLEKAGLATVVVKGGRGEIGSTAAKAGAARAAARQGGATRVRDLSDVDTVGRVDGDLLQYRSTTGKWQRTTVESITSQLAVFDDDNQGVVPASNGGTDNFLRADGEWAEPPGSGSGGSLVYANTEVPAANTVAATDSETTFGSSYTFAEDELEEGHVIRLRLAGVLSTDAAVAPTLRIRVKLGANTLLDTGILALAPNLEDQGWWADATIVVHSAGATGAVEAQGALQLGGYIIPLDNSATITVDTTSELKLTATAQWGASDADDSVTLREMVVFLDGGAGSTLAYVNTSVPAGNTVAETTTETAFDSSYTVPADRLIVGSVVRLHMAGVIGTDAAAGSDIRLRVKIGSTTILDTGSLSLAAGVDGGWWADATIVVHSAGATGAVEAQGALQLGGYIIPLENSSTHSIDTTGDLELTVTAQWADSDADNTISLRELLVYLEDVDPGDAPRSGTFLTSTDQTDTLPNSRQILGGANVELDDSVANQLTINAFPLHQKGAAWVSSSGAIEAPTVDIPVSVPWNGTIVGVTVKTQGGPGDCVIDIWKNTLANFPPTLADTITANAKPRISNGTTYNDTTLTGWTKTVAAGDVLMFHLDSVATFTFISIVLDIRETE